jgi:hypothetical protein
MPEKVSTSDKVFWDLEIPRESIVYPSLKQHHGRAKPMLKVAAFAGVLAIVCILGVLISFCGTFLRKKNPQEEITMLCCTI